MAVNQIQFSCPSGCGVLFTVNRPSHIPSEQWCQSWKDDANGEDPLSFFCSVCGSETVAEDDGTPADEDGNLDLGNESRPKATSISGATSGDIAGGTSVTINGKFLDIGTLVVKFGGVAATVGEKTDTTAAVTTPAHDAGAVDISVENEFGQRGVGESVLAAAFTYEE